MRKYSVYISKMRSIISKSSNFYSRFR